MGVPALTSDLAGFGRYVAETHPDHDLWGLHVLARRGKSFHDAASELTRKLVAFCRLNRRARIALRNEVESHSRQFAGPASASPTTTPTTRHCRSSADGAPRGPDRESDGPTPCGVGRRSVPPDRSPAGPGWPARARPPSRSARRRGPRPCRPLRRTRRGRRSCRRSCDGCGRRSCRLDSSWCSPSNVAAKIFFLTRSADSPCSVRSTSWVGTSSPSPIRDAVSSSA
jgi:hypothetical protein